MTYLRRFLGPLLTLVVGPAILCAATFAIRPDTWRPHARTDFTTYRVYAYRQWQSTGLRLNQGDSVRITARGEWLYSPYVGLHGPAGGAKPAAAWYPMPLAPGGALLGRIGEQGELFYVGSRAYWYAEAPGFLFLRINDDLLGDNSGELEIELELIRAAETPN
jgi:hypothetical protein